MFRDLSFYNISAFTFAIPRVIEVLADLIWRPQVLPSEVSKISYQLVIISFTA